MANRDSGPRRAAPTPSPRRPRVRLTEFSGVWAYTPQQLVGLLSDLHAKRVDLYLHQQGIDTTTAAGKAMFQMCGVFAEFERAMIRERVKAGLERARAQGKTLGRPRTPQSVEKQIRAARRQGKGIKKIANELGVGVSTVQRFVHEPRP